MTPLPASTSLPCPVSSRASWTLDATLQRWCLHVERICHAHLPSHRRQTVERNSKQLESLHTLSFLRSILQFNMDTNDVSMFFTQVLLFVEPTQQQPTKKENPIAITLASQPPVHLNSPTPQGITTTPRSIAGVAAAVGILPLLFGTVSPHHASRPKQHRKSEDKVDAWPWRRRRFRLLYRRL